jgi:hypothetical protein
MFTEKIIFPDGIIVGGVLFTEAILEEEEFGHTLRASSLPDIDTNRLDDQAYYAAALLAVRLKVPGLFEARMRYDDGFKELVETYAEDLEMPPERMTAARVHPVSAELIEGLSRGDGRKLLAASAVLSTRRAEFRKEALAVPDGLLSADEAGVSGKGAAVKESGGDQGDTGGIQPAA